MKCCVCLSASISYLTAIRPHSLHFLCRYSHRPPIPSSSFCLILCLSTFAHLHLSLSLSISPLGCVALRVSHHAARRGVEVHRAQQSPSEGSSLCEVQRGPGTRTSPRTAHSYIPSTHVLGRLESSPLTRQAAVQCSAVQDGSTQSCWLSLCYEQRRVSGRRNATAASV